MSQIQNLRTYIVKTCEENGSAPLVDVIARFYFHQHAIPTLNEMQQAIKGIENIQVSKEENKIHLNISGSDSIVGSNEITTNDMQTAYDSYAIGLK